MSEEQAISNQELPHTVESLLTDFHRIGIEEGMLVIVHSSLSSLGWVSGSAVAVVQALMRAITVKGTLVMPTHSGDLSDPHRWAHPPVPENWWQPIRDSMPAFHPDYTPTRGMGKIPEVFRTMPGVIRSNHPTVSFAAWGNQAEIITTDHPLEHSLGNHSPLAKIYDLDGYVMLMGVGYGNNTSFHLSEDRAHGSKLYQESSPIFENGQRIWKTYEEVDWNDEPFEQIGKEFESTGFVNSENIGKSTIKIFRQRPAVDFAVEWLNYKRKLVQSG